ncbi:MAG: hypothetical protein DMG97_02145 [Acidobacteria bacterium]|nr:MAG: hypothetical protein DMG97_02145 [Acidobacteriota bacterium]
MRNHRNHDEIVHDEENTGYAQYDLGPLWAENRDEHGDGYPGCQIRGKMQGIDGQNGREDAEIPVKAQAYAGQAAYSRHG